MNVIARRYTQYPANYPNFLDATLAAPFNKLSSAAMSGRNSPVFGVLNDYLIDSSWYGKNTDQRGISSRKFSVGKS